MWYCSTWNVLDGISVCNTALSIELPILPLKILNKTPKYTPNPNVYKLQFFQIFQSRPATETSSLRYGTTWSDGNTAIRRTSN
jgi:hypothetical protein